MVEYKIETETEIPYLMEVNGRFWGSLQLAVDAGVDFPTLLVKSALGEHTSSILEYRTGVRNRSFWGEVDHLLARLRGSADTPLPPGAPSRSGAILEFLKWRPADRCQVFRFEDPRPFIRQTRAWLRRE